MGIDARSVEFNDAPPVVDQSFMIDVPRIPFKISHAISHQTESEVDRLFEFSHPSEWAMFYAFRDFWTQLKRLFSQKVLSSFDPEFAIETLDQIHENGIDSENQEGEKLYAMLYMLKNLNEILQTIYIKLLATLKL